MSSEPAPSVPEAPPEALDQLSIDTPEQTTLEFPLAGIGSRFLAVALDTLIQAAVFLLLFLMTGLVSVAGVDIGESGVLWWLAVVGLATFLLLFGYGAFFETVWNGQTPGKRVAELRVIKDSGAPITAYEAILRNLLRIVDYLPSLYGVGIITMLCNRQNKRLGDFAAGTVVVHEKPLAEVQPLWQAQPATPTSAPVQSRLTSEEFHLVDTFLERRAFLDQAVRHRMAAQIANRLREHLSAAGGEGLHAEKFLEWLAQQYRDSARFR